MNVVHEQAHDRLGTVLAITSILFMAGHDCRADGLKPVPLTEHQYACGYTGMSLQDLHECGVTLLSHFPWTTDMEAMKQYIQTAHRLGIRLLPYISGEKAWYMDTPERVRLFTTRNPVGAIPYYQAVDPSAHPQWILIDELGRLMPRYGSYVKNASGEWEVRWGVWHAHGLRHENLKSLRPWSWTMCSSVEGYLDAVERGVKAVMDMGFDGVFVDNTYLGRLPKCQGPEFAKHEHKPDGQNTDRTYLELARRVYHTVKSYGSDKIVLLNDGTEDEYTSIRDGAMIESYINAFARRDDPKHWKKILEWAHQFDNEAEQGRFVTSLSYLSKIDQPAKEACFYTYACAGLSGFKWTATTSRPDVARLLYRARLIHPRGALQEQGGLWHRAFDRGLVVVNPDREQARAAWLSWPSSAGPPVDLYSGRRLRVEADRLHIEVERQCGRVVVGLHLALDDYVAECAVTLASVARQLGGTSDLETTLVGEQKRLQGIKEVKLDSLPPWPEGSWVSAAPTLLGWSKQLKPAKRTGSESWNAPQREEIIKVLSEVRAWCRQLPQGDHRVVQGLRAADEYAGYALDLMTEGTASSESAPHTSGPQTQKTR